MSTAALHWYVPYEKLDARQKDFVDTYKQGNKVFLQGPPGSGKTILLINIINSLRQSQPNQRLGLVTFTHSLIDMLNTGLTPGNGVRAVTYHQFKYQFQKSPVRYDMLFVDEIQDIPADVLALLRSATSQLIVAGDGNQRIFRDGCSEADLLNALGRPSSLRRPSRPGPSGSS